MKKVLLVLCIVTAHLYTNAQPLISIIVTVYNKEHQIGKVIQGIVDHTTTPFELVMVYDGCVDASERKVHETLNRSCGCMCNLVELHMPDVHETKSNNAGMKAASGTYFILLQDDMQVAQDGWEMHLIKPMQQFSDVFAVSARWAASYQPFTKDAKQQKYRNSAPQSGTTFYVRDVICRGPLALDAAVMKELNYFDEEYAPCYLDDHDLCIRAYQKLNKVCGRLWINYKQLDRTLFAPKKMSNGEKFEDTINRNRSKFWQRYKNYFAHRNHDEARAVR